MQDVEFTVENNKLWMLQTRSGKRTAKSAVKIAVDMVNEKLISKLKITNNAIHEEMSINNFSRKYWKDKRCQDTKGNWRAIHVVR